MTNKQKDTNKTYDSATIKKLPKSLVEITGSIPADAWGKFREAALKNINETVTIDGFRKGMVPENILIAKVGEYAVNEEMAELALSGAYMNILLENKIDALGKPEIRVTKLAKDNPLEFKITTAVVPEIKLPDYKSLAQKESGKASKEKITVTDKDVEDAVMKVRKANASHEGHDHSKMTPEEHEKAVIASLPELNDEFVRGLGDFKDVEDFKKKIRDLIEANKKDEAREKLRIRIADAICEATPAELPDVMIESELNRTQSQFESDIERMGVKLDDYLKHAKKSLEDIRKEWLPYAEKKAKLQLVLNAIAETEKLKPEQKDVDEEVKNILNHYKEASPESARIYAETVLTNEKVFLFLEK